MPPASRPRLLFTSSHLPSCTTRLDLPPTPSPGLPHPSSPPLLPLGPRHRPSSPFLVIIPTSLISPSCTTVSSPIIITLHLTPPPSDSDQPHYPPQPLSLTHYCLPSLPPPSGPAHRQAAHEGRTAVPNGDPCWFGPYGGKPIKTPGLGSPGPADRPPPPPTGGSAWPLPGQLIYNP